MARWLAAPSVGLVFAVAGCTEQSDCNVALSNPKSYRGTIAACVP